MRRQSSGKPFGSDKIWLDLKVIQDFSRPEHVRVFNSEETAEEKVQLGESSYLFLADFK